MNTAGVICTLIAVGLMLNCSRRWSFLPLVAGALLVPRGQLVELVGMKFSLVRILVLVGLLRVFVRREHEAFRYQGIDKWMAAWLAWMLFATLFHDPARAAVRCGDMFSIWGTYVLLRVFVRDSDDLCRVFRTLCWLLLPIAAAMALEWDPLESTCRHASLSIL